MSCPVEVAIATSMCSAMPKLFPPTANAAYPPPPASRAQLEQIHATLGIARAVLVQPTIYGTDHRALLDALRDRPQYRGVAIVNDQVTDEDLMTLHDAGIRAARFSLGGPLGGMSSARVRALGRAYSRAWVARKVWWDCTGLHRECALACAG